MANKKKWITDSGLGISNDIEGIGNFPKKGDTVSVHYEGYLEDGTVFDSSIERNQPFKFPLGEGKVIKGWDEGISTMKVSGKRTLIVPPELGYGERNMGKIPPNSYLLFDVELKKIEKRGK